MTHKELEIKIQDLFEGELDASGIVALEQELQTNAVARDLYKSYARFEGVMHHHASGVDMTKIISMDDVMRRTRKRQIRFSLISAAAIMVAVMVVMSLILARHDAPVLSLQASQGSEFSISHTPSKDQTPKDMGLIPGSRLTLRRGTVELEFSTGVRGIVRGPAELKLVDEHILELNRGKGWFEVPKSASGFQVVTPDLTLIDIGTEFGVMSLPNREDEVHVFAGTVEVTNHHYLGAKQTMKTGQASRATSAGDWDSIDLNRSDFLSELPESEPNPFADAVLYDNFSRNNIERYECVAYLSGGKNPKGYSITNQNEGLLKIIAESNSQVVLRNPSFNSGETFRVDVLTDCVQAQAIGLVLTDDPGGQRYLLRCRVMSDKYGIDFHREAKGTVRWHDRSLYTAPETLWIERVSPVQFNWYRGHAIGERSLIAEIFFTEDPGRLYTGLQGWQTTALFDDYAILKGVHSEK